MINKVKNEYKVIDKFIEKAYQHGHTQRAIAEFLGIKPQTVNKRFPKSVVVRRSLADIFEEVKTKFDKQIYH
jgi:DNA invertase Pin-like site-specific DNA recombinase